MNLTDVGMESKILYWLQIPRCGRVTVCLGPKSASPVIVCTSAHKHFSAVVGPSSKLFQQSKVWLSYSESQESLRGSTKVNEVRPCLCVQSGGRWEQSACACKSQFYCSVSRRNKLLECAKVSFVVADRLWNRLFETQWRHKPQ